MTIPQLKRKVVRLWLKMVKAKDEGNNQAALVFTYMYEVEKAVLIRCLKGRRL